MATAEIDVLARPESAVLWDLYVLSLIAVFVGLAVYALVRQFMPLRRWGSHGNVFTGPLDVLDLLVACGVVIYLGSVLFAGFRFAAQEVAGSGATHGGPVVLGVGNVVLVVLWQLMTGVLVVFYLGFLRGIELGEFFGLRRLTRRQVIGWGVGGALLVALPLGLAGVQASYVLLERAGFDVEAQQAVQLFQGTESWFLRGLLAVSAVVVAPVSEELMFRGFLYPVLKRYSDRFFAAIVVSAIFALAHSDFGTVLPLFLVGLSFAVAFEWTGNLAVPVVMHAAFNAVQVVGILLADGSA